MGTGKWGAETLGEEKRWLSGFVKKQKVKRKGKEGTYSENVEVPSDKSNIVFIGDGSTKIVVTAIGVTAQASELWIVEHSVNVKADGFVAKYMTFENSATPEQGQAAAVVSRSNLSVFYQCASVGYQDTLIAQDGWQFYRECDIYGSVDFICGGALAVFQKCNLYVNLPDHVFTITAQSKDSLESFSGYSIHNCSITVSPETKKANKTQMKGYLGRPWREYSTVVVMESFLDDILVPAGWSSWEETPLNKLTYGEFNNSGLQHCSHLR
ncbi:hypothetical protein L1049_016708 [Liquidambar formosana]|uniref:Pectinesterase catalytic domain-containing protein n=1 Tax=Liquidambar formosana TaxID=63359 RepID=A0AAP0RZT1_LIQFO